MHAFKTPQTEDGMVIATRRLETDDLEVDVSIPISPEFSAMVRGRGQDLVFAARSRLARLGVEVVPTSAVKLDEREAFVTARVSATLDAYDVARHLNDVFLPGLAVGRLVFCPEERRLSSEELFEEAKNHHLQLPRDFSIDSNGRFIIRPHRKTYELSRPLTKEEVLSILTQFDGREHLNRLQVARDVNHVVLPPHGGVITSCSMFLHRHYAVLVRDEARAGRHLAAVVLDPISTRGTRVFLEFRNTTDKPIINPYVPAEVYHALPETNESQFFVSDVPGADAEALAPAAKHPTLDQVRNAFDELEVPTPHSYSNRLVATFQTDEDLTNCKPHGAWRERAPKASSIHDVASSRDFTAGREIVQRFGTSILGDLPDDSQSTLLLGYFPNLIEHVQICQAALSGKIKRLIFRRPSYGHGPFFSSNDHSRLSDYEALGLQVYWCNDGRGQLAYHTFRGLRGYFCEPQNVERFRNSLIVAVYGSAAPLPEREVAKLQKLLLELKELFGDDLAILTGGGPGAMQQATEFAIENDLLVGANYIETEDQPTNRLAHFYQCFQGRSRHVRQRWFEISSFQVFCLGGLGTLEEVGLTMTDMKLGVIEQAPLVFYGSSDTDLYWRNLIEQFLVMADAGRAPEWLRDKVLLTDDPGEISAFYKRILELG
ncbi:MAG: LOG family protein [Planctomycetota bacterium]